MIQPLKSKKQKPQKKQRMMSSFRIIIISFFCLIMAGTLLLMLPIASRDGRVTPFSDCMFTAVSATCVTGLVVRDTATHWSFFGQAVILSLIQIGGMGVVTIGLTILRFSGRKIGLKQRSTMQSLIIELSGAALLAPVFCRDFGILKGIWYSLFHSISAFCNAGFDLMGIRGQFSSLTSYGSNIYVNTIIMLLIITGGIGFLVWGDIATFKFRIKRYSLQTKVVFITSFLLILVPALYFFFGEYSNMNMGERIISSLFQSVTTRTAGFNTQDLSTMNQSGTTIMIFLMLIGGSPGSTAGGMKTTTIAVLFMSAITVFGRRNDVQCLKRRVSDETVRTAGAILFMYLFLSITTGIIISRVEGISLLKCLFETSSAIGTVGLTLGITVKMSIISRILLMILMFFGRVGGLTLIYAAVPSAESLNSRLPLGKISVG